MLIKKIIILLLLHSAWISLCAQRHHMMGLLPDDGIYDELPQKAELLTRDYKTLPSSHSLLKYCPEVKSQNRYGTCAAWAAAYAARTIAEAIRYGWTDKNYITKEAFSPAFVYAQVKSRNDNDCQNGTHIYKALQLMKTKGVAKYKDFDMLCASNVPSSILSTALRYKIDDFYTLFSMSLVDNNAKVYKVKKALSEDCPVVIAMHLPSSFDDTGSNWSGLDINPKDHGYHAMCVVGYDDHKNGGAFHIMNSWGRNWGGDGFVWVSYKHFAKYVDQAYELYVKQRSPQPQPSSEIINKLSGKVELQ